MQFSAIWNFKKQLSSMVVALLFCTPCFSQEPVKRASSNVTGSAMIGGNAQRTRAFDIETVQEPKSLVWRTSKLYTAVKTYHSTVQSYLGSELGGSIGFGSFSSGHGHSEMVLGGDTIFFSVYINDGYIYAQDARTGKDKWRFQLKKSALSSVAVERDKVYFAAEDGSLYALDAATGREVWKKTQKARFGFAVGAPLVVDGTAYFTIVDYPNGIDNHPDGRVFALDASTGRETWMFKIDAHLTSPAYSDNTIFVGDTKGSVRALDRATGVERWKSKGSGRGIHLPIVEKGLVFTASYDGSLRAIDGKTGSEVWKTSKVAKAVTMLAADDGVLFYGGQGNNLYAVDAATGRSIWEFKTEGQCTAPVVNRGVIYVACGDSLLAVDASKGTAIWGMKKLISPLSTPLLGNHALYFIDGAARLYALK